VLTDQGLYTCGYNNGGQLGLSDMNALGALSFFKDPQSAIQTTFTLVKELPGTIKHIAAGSNHTIVLTSQGLYACGKNDYGQLGLGDKNDRTTFTPVKGLPGIIQQIAVGYRYTLVLTSQGLYACGENIYGQLGLADKNNRTTFTLVKDLLGTIQQIAAVDGGNETRVLTSQGLYVCGYNQIGLADKNDYAPFTLVKGLPGTIQQINFATCNYMMLLTNHGLYGCGHNVKGQLGLGETCSRTSFVPIKCLPSALKELLALYRQIEALITISKSTAYNTDPSLSLTHNKPKTM
jgi:alpha-tubulin suppressor-like RCC1 family protein